MIKFKKNTHTITKHIWTFTTTKWTCNHSLQAQYAFNLHIQISLQKLNKTKNESESKPGWSHYEWEFCLCTKGKQVSTGPREIQVKSCEGFKFFFFMHIFLLSNANTQETLRKSRNDKEVRKKYRSIQLTLFYRTK